MQLWTIQPIEFYQQLRKDKIIYGERQRVDVDFLSPYQWLIEKMEQRIGLRPFAECSPIWAWYQCHSVQKRKPDLRYGGYLHKGTQGVRLEICKADKDVLLSDFDLWHYPLNNWYLAESMADADAFYQRLEDEHIAFADQENYPSDLRQKIEQSWNKVLDLNFYADGITHLPDEKSIQATFWSLSLDEIVNVQPFIAR
ncbi:MAG: DUF3841 domain-containing protein [Acinetobacter sp.]|nr:DUF3841 domain-containing protein [Acinetobacter sp.]